MRMGRTLTAVLWIGLLVVPGASSAQTVPWTPAALPAAEPLPAPALPAEASAGWWAAVQQDVRRAEYHVTWQEDTPLPDRAGSYQAPNRAHNLRTYFVSGPRPTGILIQPRTGEGPAWQCGLALAAYGWAGDPASGDAVGPPDAAGWAAPMGNRIEVRHLVPGPSPDDAQQALIEWYVNDERGLKQGFTLAAPPPGTRSDPGSELVLELALSGDLTPHWVEAPTPGEPGATAIEFTTPGGVRVLRYGSLYVHDATGRPLPARLALVPSEFPIRAEHAALDTEHETRTTQYAVRMILDASSARYPITVDPLLTSPAWSAESDQAEAGFGFALGTAGDVNGDGYGDVLVGALWYDGGQAYEGRAYLYHGSAAGLASAPAWTAEGDQVGAWFGESVGTAGDVNGDGYADVIVSAPYYDGDQTDAGRVYLYHGSAAGLAAAPAWTAQGDQAAALFGSVVGTAGDVNGDGYADVIVTAAEYDSGQAKEGRAYVYHGSAAGLTGDVPDWTVEGDQDTVYLGIAAGTAGDVNGDGYADVIVSAHYYDNDQVNEGRAYVYHGSAAGLGTVAAWTAESDQANAYLGRAVGTAGDVNGDGYSDVIVGALYYDNGQVNEGRAYVYHGGPSGLAAAAAWTAESDQAGAALGRAVGTAGDVNGDGYADVIVGAHQYDGGQTDEGRAYLYYGGPSGLSAQAGWTVESDQAGAYLGRAVGTAGDVNGDGYADIIVGADQYDGGQTDEGRAWVYHGGPSGLGAHAAWTTESDRGEAYLGRTVGTAGDVNGDGYADVIVGAPRYDGGQGEVGRVLVFYGGAAGLSRTAAWTVEGSQVDSRFGYAASTAGDVNGDGYADVVVGANQYSGGWATEGQVLVYHGGPAGLSRTAAWTAEGGQTGDRLGIATGTAGDVNGDGYADVIVGAFGHNSSRGQVHVFYGSSTGLGATAGWTVQGDQAVANLGWSAGTAGDVNGDGYADVIVGAYRYDGDQQDEGRVSVYHGGLAGLSTTAAWVVEGDQAGAMLGIAAGTAGDVNGDGYADVIVGARDYDVDQANEGRAIVYHGGPAGLGTTAAWTVEGDQVGAQLGCAVGTAGDVNGDGYADVVVGARSFDSGQADEGRTYVYHGGPAGLSSDGPAWIAESDQVNAQFGDAVGAAGDVNGDGYADVLVGAYLWDSGQADAGRAYLYLGNGGAGLSLRPRQLRMDGATPIVLHGASDSQTSFKLSLARRMPLGRDKVKLQWQIAPLGSDFGGLLAQQGASGWYDSGTAGAPVTVQVGNLTPNTPYHWRVRWLYRPGNRLGQSASRWLHIPWNGWRESDLRTAADPPVAAFSGIPRTGVASLTVAFSDQSSGTIASWSWSFGDGGTSNARSPNHTYTTPGTYDVSLAVHGPGGSDVETKAAYVSVAHPPPVANFSAAPRTGVAPLVVAFSDQSSGTVTAWSWSFGDGGTSSERAPVHTYVAPGTYDVSLAVSGPGGQDSTTQKAYVQVQPSEQDDYEPNDTCDQARAIASDGRVQRHTLHRQADQDWARFDAVAGTTYRIEVQVPPESPADVVLQLYGRCGGLPEQGQDHAFSPGILLDLKAPVDGPLYLSLGNHDPSIYGSQVSYQLSVRALQQAATPGALVLVAGRYAIGDPIQPNIHYVTQAVYDTFVRNGYNDDRIYYLASDLGLPGVDALASKDNLRSVLTTWAPLRVGPNRPLTLYLMDHGDPDVFYLDQPRGQRLSPLELDGWLDEIERAVVGLKVNVIVEACYSGSFIEPSSAARVQSVSGAGRVVITSTDARTLAWASGQGAVFSDYFIAGLSAGKSLYASFQEASWAALTAHVVQRPWLDADGDGVANENEDNQEAALRGFAYAGTLATPPWPPYIAQVSGPDAIENRRGTLRAQVLDDGRVKRVWAVIYAPSYRPPPPGREMIKEDLPTMVLLDRGNDEYAATYAGFDEPGTYRVVFYAEDDRGLEAQPVALEVRTHGPIYLPLVMR